MDSSFITQIDKKLKEVLKIIKKIESGDTPRSIKSQVKGFKNDISKNIDTKLSEKTLSKVFNKILEPKDKEIKILKSQKSMIDARLKGYLDNEEEHKSEISGFKQALAEKDKMISNKDGELKELKVEHNLLEKKYYKETSELEKKMDSQSEIVNKIFNIHPDFISIQQSIADEDKEHICTYIIIILESLREIQELKKEHSSHSRELFSHRSELAVVQLVSRYLCMAGVKNDYTMKLLNIANKRFEVYEIIGPDIDKRVNKNAHITTDPNTTTGMILDHMLLGIKQKDLGDVVKKALVDAQ